MPGGFSEFDVIGTRVLLVDPEMEHATVIARRIAADLGADFLDGSEIGHGGLHTLMQLARHAAAVKPCLLYLSNSEGLFSLLPSSSPKHSSPTIKALAAAAAPLLASLLPPSAETKQMVAFSQFIDELPGDSGLVIVIGTDKISSFSQFLREAHRFNRAFEVPGISLAKTGERFIESLGRDLCDQTLLDFPAKLGFLLREEYLANISTDYILLKLLRELRETGKSKIGLHDLHRLFMSDGSAVHILVPETASLPDPQGNNKRTACHEAGHAVAQIVGSGFTEWPDYCSARRSLDYHGIAVKVPHADNHEPETYASLQNKIRNMLGGRAAEEVLLGPDQVSAGASSDLLDATKLARKYLLNGGFGPDWIEYPETAASRTGGNLAVLSETRIDYEKANLPIEQTETKEVPLFGESEQVWARLYENVRRYLEVEYGQAVTLLKQHQPLLEAIAQRLEWDVVDFHEFEEIIALYRDEQLPANEKKARLLDWATQPRAMAS
jgi:hypothetical protein